MRVQQNLWLEGEGWRSELDQAFGVDADLVLAFGSRDLLESAEHFDRLKQAYPNAQIAICSTSGEILESKIHDDSIAVTAMAFDKTKIASKTVQVSDFENSEAAGEALAAEFSHDDLRHVFVLSDGQHVNGSGLVRGMTKVLPSSVPVTGGLAGDGDRFTKTLVGLNSTPEEGIVAAIAFYGSAIKIGFGCQGGWDPFGPVRKVTRSKDNVLFELDGKPALELYKKYLGDQAEGLPGTGLLFPLSIEEEGSNRPLVRTILAVDESNGSMTFAGEVPEGARAQLMRASFDRLVDGASSAASTCSERQLDSSAEVLILISCVGRRLVLGQKTEEEVEAVRDTFGKEPAISGFYSYGEISPLLADATCSLHNQTMTITSLSEN